MLIINKMAEREGFEPSVAFRLRSLSKGVLSTTQPPFLEAGREVSIIGWRGRQPRRMDSSTIQRFRRNLVWVGEFGIRSARVIAVLRHPRRRFQAWVPEPR